MIYFKQMQFGCIQAEQKHESGSLLTTSPSQHSSLTTSFVPKMTLKHGSNRSAQLFDLKISLTLLVFPVV